MNFKHSKKKELTQKKYIVLLLIIFVQFGYAQTYRLSQWRAGQLGRGINVSWLEQYWNPKALYLNKLTDADFRLITGLGLKTIRLPVAFQHFYIQGSDLQKAKLLSDIDAVIKKAIRYRVRLVLVNHYGNLRAEYLQYDTQQLLALWTFLEKRYRKISCNSLYFELLNEPVVNDQQWLPVAQQLIAVIRKMSPDRTIIIGGSNYNSMYELSRITPLPFKNIIYTFHFYEPFIFTHQGAGWIGKQVSTTGIPFPYQDRQMPPMAPSAKGTAGEANYKNYQNEGKAGAVHDKLLIIKQWSDTHHVPILCGEYGVYRKYASGQSICNYLTVVKNELDRLAIPWMVWEYDENFSIFNGKPGMKTLSPCMVDFFRK
ncbi:cellulase family glycosylhydrolase [uncultured Pedobacter sp.]|uniref:glycoside hydrolase family 5 protein n=1 Tax=uncultured Pedobacter sp. TaxID=246139 RepID=UPI0025CD3E74|nr:cellulase family glycosylhydrolase [uncultured Pedobacter sp.]